MQAMTNKELEYVIDSMSNEDLLMKTCAAAAAVSTHPAVKSCCEAMVHTHQANYNTLLQSLQQHQTIAPMN
ncbi:hypothetical protein J40TS1_26830 [Paenibacillus montaniterrae]|uniref:Spore coat protein n=1 Tax=Paenibacillus montaniterrae TaxID=429341 RepID=A0A919YRI7_9BACL|nr:hypothetical protein [Paenibacillus montaniterrae]GIP17041.1 hypothetical protein J40TS1_26830 [Paenibacillus montaniterrae]